MGDLLLPVGPRRMSSWYAHTRRVPKPSSEPGTDWYCPIGTPVLAPGDGVLYGYGESIIPATGLWNGIDLDNGQRFRAMHYSKLIRKTGRVKRGEIIALSGASGYGVWDWSSNPDTGGAHVHGTLWPTHASIYGYHPVSGLPYTIDFMKHADLGGTAGGGSTPLPNPTPGSEEEDEEMAKNSGFHYKRAKDNKRVNLIVNTAAGWWFEYLGANTVPADSNNAVAGTLDTGSYAEVSEAFATALKASLPRAQGVIVSGEVTIADDES